MDERVYWIWMQNAFGAGSAKPMQLVRRMGSAEACFRGGIGLWSSFSFISDKELAALSAYGAQEAEAALEYCLRLGQQVFTPDTPGYPALLREIYNPPAALYVRGALPEISGGIAVGVVGTRKAGAGGLRAAREISYGLALEGAVIVSGGALGVDSEAHRGAINGRTPTVAVLPCGLDYPYLMDNANLRREIIDRGGALLTEYPMQTPVQRGAFQTRNRLISGMAHGVLVAEAPEKSGALITARYAVEQNREVFVFIGGDDPAFAGCAALAADGAVRVRTAEDISRALSGRRSDTRAEALRQAAEQVARPVGRVRVVTLSDCAPEEPAAAPQAEPGFSPDAQRVFGALGGTPKHASAIEAETGLSAGAVLAALTELELFGKIRTYPGQRFTKSV